jgi:hypothetical protein
MHRLGTDDERDSGETDDQDTQRADPAKLPERREGGNWPDGWAWRLM